jgi:hypothetical protein
MVCVRVEADAGISAAILSSAKRIRLTIHQWCGRVYRLTSEVIVFILDFPLRFRSCLNVCVKAHSCSCLFIQRIGSD